LEKIFVNLISSKRQLTGICKELSNSMVKKKKKQLNNPIRRSAKDMDRHRTEEKYRWQISI